MDYDAIDRDATVWGNAAVLSHERPLTVEEVCRETGWPMPRSADDLARLRAKCAVWGVRTNLDGEKCWEGPLEREMGGRLPMAKDFGTRRKAEGA